MRVLKFLATGAIGVTVNLGTLHLLVLGGMFYLYASLMAYALATVVGFVLQKFWTFGDRMAGVTRVQFALYVVVTLCNLALNTLVVYVLVDFVHTHYLLAQAIGAGLAAALSFFVYTLYIFKPVL